MPGTGRRVAAALLATVLCAAAGAHAEPPVLEGTLPFTAEELESALALRLHLEALPLTIVVRGGSSWIEVAYGSRLRRVEVGEARGVAAARWVALLATDLVAEERRLGEGAARPAAATPRSRSHAAATDGSQAAATDGSMSPQPAPEAPPAAPPTAPSRLDPQATSRPIGEDPGSGEPRLDATVVVAGALGSELRQVGLGASADVGVELAAPLRAWIGAGVLWVPSTTTDATRAQLTGLPVRAGLALRGRAFEVRVNGTVTPWWIDATDGPRSAARTDLVVGAGAALFYRVPLAVELRLGAGVELAFEPLAYLSDGQRVAATDALWAWVGAGVAWELVR